jgi:hypothetical protein
MKALKLSVKLAVVIGVCLPADVARPVEVLVLRVFVPYDLTAPPCIARTGWNSQAMFHNTTDATQVVQFLGVSNGTARPNAQQLTLAPHQTVTVRGSDQILHWDPAGLTPLWVNRLDAPDGVIVASRLEAAILQPDSDGSSQVPCTAKEIDYIGLPLPVVRSAVAGGVPQYFLGTDVGGKNDLEVTDSRLNIGIYNAGRASATGQVRVYCSSGAALAGGRTDVLLQTDQLAVPPNTVVQKTVLASTAASRCPEAGDAIWHAVVTVDQPSFAYAIGMANGTLPIFAGTAALAYTGQ